MCQDQEDIKSYLDDAGSCYCCAHRFLLLQGIIAKEKSFMVLHPNDGVNLII